MHFRTYVLLPADRAKTSLQAREAVAAYLEEEGFSFSGRFGGRSDYFSIGGRWSGSLTLLRLKCQNTKQFREFWRRFERVRTREQALSLFRRSFPDFRGSIPVERKRVGFYGLKDDAEIMTRALFAQLKRGFARDVNYSWKLETPNVISTEDYEDSEWPDSPETAEGQNWIVVVDYHD